ncbi:hypothetical protein ADUPG1_013731, partial [Aduncisulcus paluster]
DKLAGKSKSKKPSTPKTPRSRRSSAGASSESSTGKRRSSSRLKELSQKQAEEDEESSKSEEEQSASEEKILSTSDDLSSGVFSPPPTKSPKKKRRSQRLKMHKHETEDHISEDSVILVRLINSAKEEVRQMIAEDLLRKMEVDRHKFIKGCLFIVLKYRKNSFTIRELDIRHVLKEQLYEYFMHEIVEMSQ